MFCNIHQYSMWPNPWITGLWPNLTWHICSSWDALHRPGYNQEPLLWLQTSAEHIHELQISGHECEICFLQPLSPTDPTKKKNTRLSRNNLTFLLSSKHWNLVSEVREIQMIIKRSTMKSHKFDIHRAF